MLDASFAEPHGVPAESRGANSNSAQGRCAYLPLAGCTSAVSLRSHTSIDDARFQNGSAWSSSKDRRTQRPPVTPNNCVVDTELSYSMHFYPHRYPRVF